MKVLYHEDEPTVKAHSSIDQYKGFLAAYDRGGETPIEFDYIDYVKCVGKCGEKEIVSHPVIVEFGDSLGYDFPIGECSYITDDYPLFDKEGVETRVLPEEYGGGFYQAYDKAQVITNFDDGSALGIRNNYKLKIGLDYLRTDKVLPHDDIE